MSNITNKIRQALPDIDTYREILDTLTRNKSRSFLTGFGVFWGVFMLIILIGGGQGLKELLAKNFEGFASNTMLVFADKTTKAYDGFRKGRQWNTTDVDVERLRHQVPELDVVTPMVFANSTTIVYGDKKSTGSIKGVYKYGCELFRKRIECALMLKAAAALDKAEE